MNGKKEVGTLIVILLIVGIMAVKFYVGNSFFSLIKGFINF